MIPAEKVIIAIDTQDAARASAMLTCLAHRGVWIKLGLEAFYALGPAILHQARDNGFRIFLDLKLHDIPNTVASALRALSSLPFDMINVHAAGGREMLLRSRDALGPSRALLIAVTQLTSTSETQMQDEQLITSSLQESVLHYARLAKEAGLDGVVCSAHEIEILKASLGQGFKTVTPGIRPPEASSDDQKRIMTPLEAHLKGTDFMVIGRPITSAPDPLLALQTILKG